MQNALVLILVLCALPSLVRGETEPGIPVTNPVVLAKCASCHAVDEHGNMQRLSFERATPEGWEEALKRMIRENLVTLTPPEARAILKYLSTKHGLAPQETAATEYYAERRIHDESGVANDTLLEACGKCHHIARVLSWRRSADDWRQFAAAHAEQYKFKPSEEAIALLAKTAPLHTPDWTAWSQRKPPADLTGRWVVTAHVLGRGLFYGEMEVRTGQGDGEYSTNVTLNSVATGSACARIGRGVLYAGHEWRGRSKGANTPGGTPDDLSNETREVMSVSPDGSQIEGRWFWGQYQEFGFDVKLQRASNGPTLLAIDRPALRAGSEANRIRLIGDGFPVSVKPADITVGPGVTVRRLVSSTAHEIVAEMDVAADAALGKRNVAVLSATLPGALAIYDRVDYVKVTPESAMAAFGDDSRPRGFQQFEAIGYQRGPDGKLHTADDLELGPVDADWSMEVFYEVDHSKSGLVGKVSATGFFTPAAESPNANYDVWVIATAKNESNKDGKPLVGKGYVVVTIPSYTFNGRKYVRELDRWVEDGQ